MHPWDASLGSPVLYRDCLIYYTPNPWWTTKNSKMIQLLTHFLELEVGKDMWVTGSIKLLTSYDTSWVIIWPPVFPTQISCVILDMGCNHQSAGFWWFFRFSQKLSLFQGHCPWLWLWLGPTLMQPAGATSWCNQLHCPDCRKKPSWVWNRWKRSPKSCWSFHEIWIQTPRGSVKSTCTDRPFQQSARKDTAFLCFVRRFKRPETDPSVSSNVAGKSQIYFRAPFMGKPFSGITIVNGRKMRKFPWVFHR